MEETRAVRTGADGRFVLDGEKDFALFRHPGWYSVTVSFELDGYAPFQTNFTIADLSRYASDGAPVVDAGLILLQPNRQ